MGTWLRSAVNPALRSAVIPWLRSAVIPGLCFAVIPGLCSAVDARFGSAVIPGLRSVVDAGFGAAVSPGLGPEDNPGFRGLRFRYNRRGLGFSAPDPDRFTELRHAARRARSRSRPPPQADRSHPGRPRRRQE